MYKIFKNKKKSVKFVRYKFFSKNFFTLDIFLAFSDILKLIFISLPYPNFYTHFLQSRKNKFSVKFVSYKFFTSIFPLNNFLFIYKTVQKPRTNL